MKMSKSANLISFMFGMAIGSAVTWHLLNERYQSRWEEEIAEYKAAHRPAKNQPDKAPDAEEEEPEKRGAVEPGLPLKEYTERLQREGYTNYTNASRAEEGGPVDIDPTGPVVISPEEFGEIEDYEKLSLTYYADGVLTDSDNDEINDPMPLIGDALEHFGEFDQDTVLVRNDERRCYYEVLRDLRQFETEIYPNLPRRY